MRDVIFAKTKNQDNLKLLPLLAYLVFDSTMYMCPTEAYQSSIVAVGRDQDLRTGKAT